MQKTAIIAAAISLTLISTSIVFAQDSTSTATVKPPRPLIAPRLAQGTTTTLQQRFDKMTMQIASHEAELKLKLQAFRDQKKAQIADRVNTNLSQINQNRTKEMQANLDKMSKILDKLDSLVSSNSPFIKDPVATKAAIVNARAKIATASAAVTAQSTNDYTITVTSESAVRLNAQTQRNKLFTDLKTVRQLIVDARQSVANALRVATGLGAGGLGTGKEGTPSGSQ